MNLLWPARVCEDAKESVDYYATLLQQNSKESWFARVVELSDEDETEAIQVGRDMSDKLNYHAQEAIRIQAELDDLGAEFAEDGLVRIVLRRRIAQEQRKAAQAASEEESNS